jgi:hypothetical protein
MATLRIYLRRIGLSLLLLILAGIGYLWFLGKYDRYEAGRPPEEQCAKAARKHFESIHFIPSDTASISSHYNAKLERCFSVVEDHGGTYDKLAGSPTFHGLRRIVFVEFLDSYYKSASSFTKGAFIVAHYEQSDGAGSPERCEVMPHPDQAERGLTCKSRAEFESAIKQFTE